MDLSANDIRRYEFTSVMRGYSREEVEDFQEQVAAALERASEANHKLSKEVESTRTELNGLRQFEDAIKNAAIDARRNADQTIADAKAEAERILQTAKKEAESIVGTRSAQAVTLKEQITKLELAKKSYASKLATLIQSHLDLVEELAGDTARPPTVESIEVEASEELRGERRETLAAKPRKTHSVKTEEANAAGQIIRAASPKDATAKEEAGAEPPSDKEEVAQEPSVDPELAAALQRYGRPEDNEPPRSPQPAPSQNVSEAQSGASSSQIPTGFVPKVPDSDDAQTDRIKSADGSAASEDPNTINADVPVGTPPETKKPMPQVDIAEELDKVVAKFEEEIEKAEKS